MQLKIYKRSTIFLALIIIIDLFFILFLINNRQLWQDNKTLVIVFVLLVFVLSLLYAYHDLNADKNIIKKCVANGDVALAKIKDGSFVRFARNARLKNHVYWQLNVDIFDNDMKKIETTIIEKFSTHQTSIPKGYVYVTYNENRPQDSLIIPNIIISSISEYQPLVEDYEKKIKPKYLNAYINDGLILKSYDETIKEMKKDHE